MTSGALSSDPSPESSALTAFVGFQRIAAGPFVEVIAQLRDHADAASALVFDDRTGERLDLDLRPGTAVMAATAPAPAVARSVGRPRLGVVAREVTLLPRHWDWLNRQPGGASVALRRLVDDARRVHVDRDVQRAAREAAYRFMTAIAGDLPGFEEATRALFAGEQARFDALILPWPGDVAAHACKLAVNAWALAPESAAS